MNSKSIQIIGGGINGATTGIVLQLLGYDTEILTRRRADRVRRKTDPSFASLYPSASILPHSVYTDELTNLFLHSKKLFGLLHEQFPELVAVHKHYEVFEYPVDRPDYAGLMDRFREIEQEADLPQRDESQDLFGWVFDCYFADWPRYLPRVFKWYEQLGGTIRIQAISPGDIPELDREIIVNCSGLGSFDLFEEENSTDVLRGHLVKILQAPLIKNRENEIISYNYTPRPEVYSSADGTPCDLYCYPRSDGWIIGGTRQKGALDHKGKWQGEDNQDPITVVEGIELPEKIISLNRTIIENSYGINMRNYPNRKAFVGYRYVRDTDSGIRIERRNVANKEIIHNYGHGGAGVTLSWGSAVKVASLVAERHPIPGSEFPGQSFLREMREVIRSIMSNE